MWISCTGIVMFYFGILFAYGSNNPQSDDFFDTLIFLEMYHQKTTITEKVALFFWQYEWLQNLHDIHRE